MTMSSTRPRSRSSLSDVRPMIVIPPHVDPGASSAVDAEPRPAALSHPDEVEGANAEVTLDTRAELVGPHLRAEEADAQRERADIEALLARGLDHPQRVRRDRGHDGRF